MALREMWLALRAQWWLPLVGVALGLLLALGYTALATPLYASRTQLFVSTTDSASTSAVYQGSQFSQQRVSSYAQLLRGEELATRVVDRLDLPISPAQLGGKVRAAAVTETVLLNVTVTDTEPERAAAIADALGEEFTTLVAELETPDGESISPVKVTVVDAAEVDDAPVSPAPRRNLVLGALLGLLGGAALAVLRSRLDTSVRTEASAASLAAAPVIGLVARDESLEKRHTIDRSSSSRVAEDYRQLRNNLQFLDVDHPPKVIMVTSAVPAEGKTTVVVNLGLALADTGRSVTIIEADLRRPKVTRYLGMVAGAGLTNVLAGTAEIGDVRQRYGDSRLSVVAAGPTPPNPGELLSSSQMAGLIARLREESDYVLVDAPPLLPVADASGMAVMMDGVLLSVRFGSTTRDQVRQAAATLDGVGAKTLGVILNIVPPKAEIASAYGYGYDYGTESRA